jgi:putative heme iron utilization protein
MNADHGDASIAMVKHYAGISVDTASMMSLDRYGIDMKCVKDGEVFNCRLGFPTVVQDRKQIKEAIVAMTKEAAAAASKE